MTDTRIRMLERQAVGGGVATAAQLLRAQVRAGIVTETDAMGPRLQADIIRDLLEEHDEVYARDQDGRILWCTPLPDYGWRADGSHQDVLSEEIELGYRCRSAGALPREGESAVWA